MLEDALDVAGPGTDWGGDAVRPAFLPPRRVTRRWSRTTGWSTPCAAAADVLLEKGDGGGGADDAGDGRGADVLAQESERLQTQAEVEYAALMKRNGKAIPATRRR